MTTTKDRLDELERSDECSCAMDCQCHLGSKAELLSIARGLLEENERLKDAAREMVIDFRSAETTPPLRPGCVAAALWVEQYILGIDHGIVHEDDQ